MAGARPRLAAGPPAWQSYPVTSVQPADPAKQRRNRTIRIDVRIRAAAEGLVFRALGDDGDLAAASLVSPVSLSAYFTTPEWTGTWRMRSEQVEQDPASAAWVTGVIWDEQQQVAVGRAGYHGPPDQSGMVEIGYAVDPAYRRRGYARAALEALLARAAREPQVRTVRVSISPDNTASAQSGLAVWLSPKSQGAVG